MALAGKHAQVVAGITNTLLYTAPTNVMVKVGVTMSNTDSVQRTCGLLVEDVSAATTMTKVPSTTPIPVGSALQIKGIQLEAGDKLHVIADAAAVVECMCEVVELT